MTEVLKRDDLEDAEQFLVGYYPAFMAKAKQIKENSLSKIAVVFKDGGIYLFTGEYRDGTDQQLSRQFSSYGPIISCLKC